MTHQGSAVARQRPPTVELSRTRRSLSAATVKFGSDCVRRHSVYIGGAFPRLHPKGTSSRFALRAPRRFAPRNDKPLAFTILSTAVPQRKKSGMPENPASPIGSLTYRTVPWRGRGGRPRSGSSAAPRGPRCRWSRRRSCRRSYPHRRAPWQPRSACRASAP